MRCCATGSGGRTCANGGAIPTRNSAPSATWSKAATPPGEPVGYIQCWFVGEHQTEEWAKDHPWLLDLPADAVGVDLSIGDPDRLSQGIGSAALSAFVRMLREEGRRTIVIDPDPANARAVRAYEKAGFRVIPELAGRTAENVLLMRFEPEA